MNEPIASSSGRSKPAIPEDDTYDAFLAAVRAGFEHITRDGAPLFTTDASGLLDAFLEHLPAELRPLYTCGTCRRFMEDYGGAVTISKSGAIEPVMWHEAAAPPPFRASVAALSRVVKKAAVTGVLLSTAVEWGRPLTGAWTHLSVTPPAAYVHTLSPLGTLSGALASKREDHALLLRGLSEFSADLVARAHTLLRNGALFRSEKCEGVARWLMEVHAQRNAASGDVARDNVVWLAAARAPAGFCHVRSTMIGTLLEDLAAELPFAEIKAKFDAKMSPLQYQRPTAAPGAVNLARAEAIVAELRSAGALDRRFALLEDVEAVWAPPPRDPPRGGVFGHLAAKVKAAAVMDMPAVTMTWDKFARTVLPDAARIEYSVPAGVAPYYALVTAAHADAPPIFQWDHPERRNPVSWYTYPSGTKAQHWGLSAGDWREVTKVALMPFTWGGGTHTHQGEGVLFLLQGARDTQHQKGAALFPEMLRSEYREIRKTIEAYSAEAVIAGRDEAEACGVCYRKSEKTWSQAKLRVTPTHGPAVVYQLDRWD